MLISSDCFLSRSATSVSQRNPCTYHPALNAATNAPPSSSTFIFAINMVPLLKSKCIDKVVYPRFHVALLKQAIDKHSFGYQFDTPTKCSLLFTPHNQPINKFIACINPTRKLITSSNICSPNQQTIHRRLQELRATNIKHKASYAITPLWHLFSQFAFNVQLNTILRI